jgi:ferritin-like metal-binding protein YciE
MATMKNLEDAFVEELKDILHAEKQLIKALPKMSKAAHDPELKQAFDTHNRETQEQIKRLERVFESMDRSPRARRCEAMEGLVKEGEHMIQEKAEPEVNDAVLIASAQKIEHYEIASYGTVCAWAEQLGLNDAAELLKQTLSEEKQTDQKLNHLAETVNRHAQPH